MELELELGASRQSQSGGVGDPQSVGVSVSVVGVRLAFEIKSFIGGRLSVLGTSEGVRRGCVGGWK